MGELVTHVEVGLLLAQDVRRDVWTFEADDARVAAYLGHVTPEHYAALASDWQRLKRAEKTLARLAVDTRHAHRMITRVEINNAFKP